MEQGVGLHFKQSKFKQFTLNLGPVIEFSHPKDKYSNIAENSFMSDCTADVLDKFNVHNISFEQREKIH